jgi:hypothetical protein
LPTRKIKGRCDVLEKAENIFARPKFFVFKSSSLVF